MAISNAYTEGANESPLYTLIKRKMFSFEKIKDAILELSLNSSTQSIDRKYYLEIATALAELHFPLNILILEFKPNIKKEFLEKPIKFIQVNEIFNDLFKKMLVEIQTDNSDPSNYLPKLTNQIQAFAKSQLKILMDITREDKSS